MKKIALTLETGKTAELSEFRISGSNTVSMNVCFVELELTIPYCADISGYSAWKLENPGKTLKDYARMLLLPIYNSYAMAKSIRDALESEAKET